jgi:hypothetical protein
MISWTTAVRSEVRCASPEAPATHGSGDHVATADVVGRDERSKFVVVKTDGLSVACPLIVRVVATA